MCVNLYRLKIIPLFSSTYSYPHSVHFFILRFTCFLVGFLGGGKGVVLGKREEGGRMLLQFVSSY